MEWIKEIITNGIEDVHEVKETTFYEGNTKVKKASTFLQL